MKRLISIMLTIAMLITSCISVSAISVNMNTNDGIETVQTDSSKFFNVSFKSPDYTPDAEQVHQFFMGTSIIMWRHSGGSTENTWNTGFWGRRNDAWVKKLWDGNIIKPMELETTIPAGVQNYIRNGGSWDDVQVTFICMNEDGVAIEPKSVFQNGAVDCWIKSDNKIVLKFIPKFKTDTKKFIYGDNTIKINRGVYPFSFAMFSMWNNGTHYGATRVHDVENGEPETKYQTDKGYDTFTYDDILNSNGNITKGLTLRNFEAYKPKTETGETSQPTISTSVAKIGDGTFNMGGATGLGFEFPVKVIFEINPKNKGRASIVNEVGFVEVGSRETYGHLQMYGEPNSYLNSFKDDSGNALGSTEALKKVLKT